MRLYMRDDMQEFPSRVWSVLRAKNSVLRLKLTTRCSGCVSRELVRGWFLAACLLCLTALPVLASPVTAIDPDAHYPEGPLWRDGKLFYVEYSASNIKSWDG